MSFPKCFLVTSALLVGISPLVAQPSNSLAIPQRGTVPNGSYAVSQIENVDTVSGNVSIHIPLTALPPGRAGFSTAVDLYYNSSIYGTQTSYLGGNTTLYTLAKSQFIDPSDSGGWHYGYEYSFVADYSLDIDNGCGAVPVSHASLRYRIIFPDGSSHTLYMGGRADYGSGYNDYAFNGCNGIAQGGQVNLYSADGTYVRVAWNADTGDWTLYFPDGRRVAGSLARLLAFSPTYVAMVSEGSDLYDRNGNRIHVGRATSTDGTLTTTLTDDLNRAITIQHPPTGTDTITQIGYNNQSLTWSVAWTGNDLTASHTYQCGASSPCNANALGEAVVGSILLPDNLTYQFCYDGAVSQAQGCPNSNPGQWGQLSYMTLPTGAHVQYTYPTQPNLAGAYWERWSPFVVSSKVLTWTDQADNSPRTEQTSYAFTNTSSTFTNPDGSSTTGFFYDMADTNSNPFMGLVFKTQQQPSGNLVERFWSTNVPFGTSYNFAPYHLPGNPFVQTELTSLGSGASTIPAAAKVFSYDRNGNQTAIYETDCLGLTACIFAHPNGSEAACPPSSTFTGGTLVRTTYILYVNGASPAICGSSGPTTDDAQGYWNAHTPQLLDLVSKHTVLGTPGASTEFTYDYDGPLTHGNVTQLRRWDSTKGILSNPLTTGNSAVTNNNYDGYGNLLSTQDPRLNTTQYTYGTVCGGTSLQATSLYPTQIIQAGVRTFQFPTWDCYAGVKISDVDVDHALARTFDYDQFGRNTSIQEGNVRKTTISYSDSLRTITVKRDRLAFGETSGQLTEITSYDQLGRVRQTQDPAGNLVQMRYITPPNTMPAYTGFSYELVSNPYITQNESTMGWTLTKRDTLGRAVRVEHFTGASTPGPWSGGNGSSTGFATMSYNANCTATTDESTVASWNRCVDGLGRLTQVTENGISSTTAYSYDELDNLIGVNQGGVTTPPCPPMQFRCFNYSSLSRLTSATNPESGTIGYTYDDNGNLHTLTDARNILTTFTYNELDQVLSKTYSNDGGVTPAVGYAYNKGWLTQVQSSASTYAYTSFDGIGRVTAATQTTPTTNGASYPFQVNYYPFMGLKDITYPGSNRKITTGYDVSGRANTVSGQIGTNPVTTYTTVNSFATTGALVSQTLGNLLTETWNYNPRLQPTLIRLGGLLTLVNCYDSSESSTNCANVPGLTATNNGNLQGQKTTRSGVTSTQNYIYDAVNRLTSAIQTGSVAWSQGYKYDNYGNRWLDTYSGALPAPSLEVPRNSSAYNFHNQIPGFNYDFAGNILDVPATNSLRHATYDAENRMKTMSLANGDQATYDYDGNGRRVKKTVTPSGAAAITTVFVYDPMGGLAAEFGSTNDTGTRYLTDDHLGSTRLITKADGSVDKTYDYLPFGEEYSPVAPIYPQLGGPNSIKFTSKERDSETGLDYFGARYFSSAQGRFTSPDWSATPQPIPYAKLENPQSLNLYGYVLNNPLSLKDDDGHEIIYADGLKNSQLVRDTVTAILANPNTSGYLSGYVGANNPNLTITSGDLGPPKVEVLPNGQTLTTTVQGNTEPDIQTSSFNGGPPETQFKGATVTIDNKTSKGDTPGVLIHESVHAGEAQQNPAKFVADAKSEKPTPHDKRPQEERANAVRHANEKDINKAVKQIEKDRKKEQ